MKTIYSNHPIDVQPNSIFLAGPTPRSISVKSWRPEALDILDKTGFNGTVYVPEWDCDVLKISYIDQVEWEYAHLENCGVIMFWVPRKLPEMMAMTTNTEFGSYVRSNRMVYGRPLWAEKCDYLDWLYEKITNKKPLNNLEITLQFAINKLYV